VLPNAVHDGETAPPNSNIAGVQAGAVQVDAGIWAELEGAVNDKVIVVCRQRDGGGVGWEDAPEPEAGFCHRRLGNRFLRKAAIFLN